MTDLSDQRRDYALGGLLEAEAPASPWPLLQRWYAEAAGLYEPNAMVLATVDEDGLPDARTVLLKSFDERGLVFFTQHDSAKARALAHQSRCALLLPWFELQRQVRVRGDASVLARAEVEAYFVRRPRDSQLGAWASIQAGGQSQVVADRAALDAAYRAATDRFPESVPTPPTWGGYRVRVNSIEFWQGRHGRLHDRLRYRDPGEAGEGWIRERLAP